MNPGQEERDSAASKRSRHPVSLEPAGSLYRDTWGRAPPPGRCPLVLSVP